MILSVFLDQINLEGFAPEIIIVMLILREIRGLLLNISQKKKTEEAIQSLAKKLEKMENQVNNLLDMHKDPESLFSTYGLKSRIHDLHEDIKKLI